MTPEEFKANLQMIRSYHKSLSNFEAKWLGIAVPEQSAANHLRHGEVTYFEGYTNHEAERMKYFKQLERDIKKAKPSNYPSEFEFEIRQIIQSVISNEEDNGEEPAVIEVGIIKEPDRYKRRFMILYDYYINGYEEDHILKRYDLNARSTITSHQIPKGIEELYKLYNERSNDNEKS